MTVPQAEPAAAAVAYLDGRYLPLAEARVSPLDRGFLFADGVYEVIPAYGGLLFRLPQHLQRLQRSLDGIRLPNPHSAAAWTELLSELVRRSGERDQNVYLQVTRGVSGGRAHDLPSVVSPTVFAMSTPITGVDAQTRAQGAAVITLADTRWQNCHLKTIALLPNVLLKQQAWDAGAMEALLIRDGQVVEGSTSNLFAVLDGVLVTPPESNYLLTGITRDLVLELARRHGIPCTERPITPRELGTASELWITSSTREVVPVSRLDGRAVGAGRPGPVWQHMDRLYQAFKAEQRHATA